MYGGGEEDEEGVKTRFRTFFLKLLDEERHPAPSHLSAQQLFALGASGSPAPFHRHVSLLASTSFGPRACRT